MSIALTALFAVTVTGATSPAFEREVLPILRDHCVGCHGPSLDLGGARLDRRGDAMDFIEPGDPDGSLLIRRLTEQDLGILMPPTGRLDEEEIDVLRAWVAAGAEWPEGVTVAEAATPGDVDIAAAEFLLAIESGDVAKVRRLAEHDSRVLSARRRDGSTPLMHAALWAEVEVLQALLDLGADVNASNSHGATALMLGAKELEKVERLVAAGARLDAMTEAGRTALDFAAARAFGTPVLEALFAHGLSPREVAALPTGEEARFGVFALVAAVRVGDAEMVRCLLEHGERAGFLGACFFATRSGSPEILQLLLDEAGPGDPTAVTLALEQASAVADVHMMRVALDAGAAVDGGPRRPGRRTPLMLAAASYHDNVEAIDLLLARSADASLESDGETARAFAERVERSQVIEALALAEGQGATATNDREAVLGMEPPSLAIPTRSSESPPPIAEAVEKSVALLQRVDRRFFARSGCIACHQQSITAMVTRMAEDRGLRTDREQTRASAAISGMLAGELTGALVNQEFVLGDVMTVAYGLLERSAAGAETGAMVRFLANQQNVDGSWRATDQRPPMTYRCSTATALSLWALGLHGAATLGTTELEEIRSRALRWLEATEPADTEDRVSRLIALAEAGATDAAVAVARRSLLATQREDGGWAQLDHLSSDAYATGSALFALHGFGALDVDDPAYQRGVRYLRESQLPDGSWHVKSRTLKVQPYFESGFPHGHDQWLSAGATAWATMALMFTIDPTDR